MKILILALLAMRCCASEAAPDLQLPPDATKIVSAYDEAAARIQSKADADLAKERDKARKALTAVQEKVTKAGNLDGALAIKAMIAKLDELQIRDVVPLGTPILSRTIIGRWVATDGNWIEFKASGRLTSSWGDDTTWVGIDAATVEYTTNVRHTITSSGENSLKVERADGHGFALARK